ncbi:AhpC/TSA family protein [Puniceicoccaceae bacterium K14]|nr:AhpC/TSA family protein [Puniceicoccaceae bacterium K14]
MKELRELTKLQIEKSRRANPKFMQAIESLMKFARAFGDGGEAIGVGKSAPGFELPNAVGETVSLAALLEKGPVVVSFSRGSWCPYCNLETQALRARLAEIKSLGAELVVISPQKPDDSLSEAEKAALRFHVLSDQDARVAADYGVAWKVPDLILEHMRSDRKLDLEEINNGNGSILPIPGVFVLGCDSRVVWRFVDVDYRMRAEPDDIISALQVLAGNSPK